MASTELYSSQGKRKKKLTFGQSLGDLGRLIGDNALSAIGMQDVISNDSYNTEWAGNIADISNKLYGFAGQAVLAATTGGVGNAATAALGKAVGPKTFAGGGVKEKTPQELTGPTIRGKKYPKETIITDNPNDPRLKAYSDSLSKHTASIKSFKKYQEFIKKNPNYQDKDLQNVVFIPSGGDVDNFQKEADYWKKYMSGDVTYRGEGSTGYYGDTGKGAKATFPEVGVDGMGGINYLYKAPTQPIIYEPSITKMSPKGLPTTELPTPQMLNMPDRIEMDSKKGAEYKGLKVSHYTDGMGRYTAKLNLTTTPGVEGRISYADGGLRTFEGNTHEQGGIKLGNDEVEDSETMVNLSPDSDYIFSDRIIVPDTKQSFAAKSKRISKKYSLRPNDPYGKKSEELELKRLANEQELVKSKSKSLTTNANHMAMGGMRYDGGGGRVEPFRMTPLYPQKDKLEDYSDLSFPSAGWAYRGKGLATDAVRGLTGMSPITPQEYYLASDPEGEHLKKFDTYRDEYDEIQKTPYDYKIQDITSDWNMFMRGVPGYENVSMFDGSEKGNILADTPRLTKYEQEYANNQYAGKPKGAIADTKGFSSEYITPLPMKSAGQITSKMMAKPLSPEIKSKANPLDNPQPYKSNFLPTALGYAAQAATNIPALFTKPETINSARVKFGKLNLAEQRNEARRNRNLALATAKGIGANDTGQMMNYLSGATAALNSAYGNQFNQSLLAEQEANLETNMREQLANSEIERYDEQINAQERDAARSLRMNALQNLGTISAMTGKDYLSMQQTDDYLAALSAANPDYGLKGRTPYRKRAYGGTRKRAMGGKY